MKKTYLQIGSESIEVLGEVKGFKSDSIIPVLVNETEDKKIYKLERTPHQGAVKDYEIACTLNLNILDLVVIDRIQGILEIEIENEADVIKLEKIRNTLTKNLKELFPSCEETNFFYLALGYIENIIDSNYSEEAINLEPDEIWDRWFFL